MSGDIWQRWQFLFGAENQFRDKLIDRIESLKKEGEWQNQKNYGVREAFENAELLYAKTQITQDIGKLNIKFKNTGLIVWFKQSFYYEIDVCMPVDGENKSIEDIITDFDKMNFCALKEGTLVCNDCYTVCNFIKDHILLELQKDVIAWSILLNFYKYRSIIEVGAVKIEAPVEKLLDVSLSKISADYSAISKITNSHLFFASEYKESVPMLFIKSSDSPSPCVETDGGTDVVHDILSLHLAGELLKKEKQKLFETEKQISKSDSRIYSLIEETITSGHDISKLKEEFLNVLNLKKSMSKSNENVSEIRRATRSITEILNDADETIIRGGGIIKHFSGITEKRNENINILMKKLYKNLNALEQTILEAISTETLSGIQKSISVQEQISEILESTHMMHAGILILEIVIFAEIFIKLIESYPGYAHFKEMMKFELVIAAMFLGVIFAVTITRFIIKKKILEKLLE